MAKKKNSNKNKPINKNNQIDKDKQSNKNNQINKDKLSNKDNQHNKNKDSGTFSDLKRSLSEKYKIEEIKTDLEEVESNLLFGTVEEETKKPKHSNASEADDIGWNKWKILLRNFLYGIFMGFSDGIPGYSGGTTLTIIKFYDQFIHNVKMIFKPDVNKYFWKYLCWVLPFVIAWVGVLIGFMFLVNKIGNQGNGIILVFLFGFFAIFSIPLFYITNKDKIPNLKTFSQQLKQKDQKRRSYIYLGLFIFAILLMVAIGLIARYVSVSHLSDGSYINGVTFLNATGSGNFSKPEFQIDVVFGWFFAGFLAGFCMLIPGVSGSLMLYTCNIYPNVSFAISNITSDGNYVPYLIVLVLGIILGLITSSLVVNWFLKRFEKYFMSFSAGLVCASFLTIFISLSSADYATLSDSLNLGLSIAMIFIAIIINVAIFIALNETKKIDYPKFRIFNRQKIATKKSS